MTSMAPIPYQALTAFLVELATTGAVTLKNGDLFANFARGGDWDLLVADVTEAERTLVKHVGLPDRVTHRSYVHSYFYPWGEIDLLPDWMWRGARLLDRGALFGAGRLSPSGVFPVVDLAHEATIGWFNSILWGRTFNPRYAGLVERAVAESPEELQGVLGQVFGRRWQRRLWSLATDGRPGDALSHADALRRAVLRRALRRSPVGTVAAWMRLWVTEVALRRRPVVPWLWADERDADDLAERLRIASAETGGTLAGVRVYRWPGGFLPVSLLRALRQYWGPVAKDRVNGQLVIFVPSAPRPPLTAAYARLGAPADMDLTAGQPTADDLWPRIRREMQRRTAALVGDDQRLKVRPVSPENVPEGHTSCLGGDPG